MPNIMVVLSRLSKALDSKIIGEVFLALQDLDKENIDVEKCEESFTTFLREIVSWDLTKSPEISQNVVEQLLNLLKTQTTVMEMCESILKAQTAVAVQVAVEKMIGENWTLSRETCREVWKTIEARKGSKNLNENKIHEYASRVTANCRILRVSGTPTRFIKFILVEALKDISQFETAFPGEFLNEFAVTAPFHPIIIAESMKNYPNVFLIPQVVSDEYRSGKEIEEFVNFFQHPLDYHKRNGRSLLEVFLTIWERMTYIELLKAEDIETIVNFWLAAFCIFDGYGIGMNDITEAAKKIEKTTLRFDIKSRPLFLKRFLRKISDKKESINGLEPQIVATIITTYQRIAFSHRSYDFYEELGEFWTLCFKVKYDDIYYSTVFYSSVFALAQAQAVFRVKKELCRAVYTQILQPMHQQIVDFVKLKEVESKDSTTDAELMLLEQKNIGSSYFSILTCTYKNAVERILEFIGQ